MLIYRFCLAYMFRNYARIPRPTFSLDNCFDIICKFGYTQCNTFERKTLHGNTMNYLSLLMGDAQYIRHTPGPPPPPPPPTQHCFPQEIPFKTARLL